jgi:hypothetical protein
MTTPTLHGGCLCGAIRYELEPPLLRFAHCHCSRCRRATGSSHASNLYAEPDRFRWISGQGSLRRYDLPSAQSFATTFCTVCGAPLPHATRSGREIVIPAGSLDAAPQLAPSADIFFGSRPSWSCANHTLPRFDGYADGWRRAPSS